VAPHFHTVRWPELAGRVSVQCGSLTDLFRDIVADPASCVFDARLTQTDGALVRVFGWYDNAWVYARRLVDLTELFADRY
jgi:glyceraldehyde-3-phosphate dehydrogenase/erythrose-4-phosphate dehydrogenase